MKNNTGSVCARLEIAPMPPLDATKLGIALETLGQQPINGLRHKPEGETNGWYLWCGTSFSEGSSFFSPLHIEHVESHLPQVLSYLDLPPGYRFLIDDKGVEDVWFDQELLNY